MEREFRVAGHNFHVSRAIGLGLGGGRDFDFHWRDGNIDRSIYKRGGNMTHSLRIFGHLLHLMRSKMRGNIGGNDLRSPRRA